ncbi:hypothetical protein GEV33_002519 [Tenebrio molitor]|uniref:Uncharacterized protein n=1 Tax=Tenebrio molitor TaxID=7067 RepID=A0A8J6HTZ7_TENMO|nr:hypothetical protein GEV33_002519 [Tenebrio molitor]
MGREWSHSEAVVFKICSLSLSAATMRWKSGKPAFAVETMISDKPGVRQDEELESHLNKGQFVVESPLARFVPLQFLPQKGRSSYNPVVAVEKPTTRHLAEQFPEKGQSKNSGATAGSLRRATFNAPRRRNHHRQRPPSPESRSPASGSGQHRSNYGQSFLFLAEICHQERTICSVNLRNPSYLVDAQNPSRRKCTRTSAEKSAHKGGGSYKSGEPETEREIIVTFCRWCWPTRRRKVPPPKSPSGSRTSLRKVPNRTLLRIRISSGPVSPGRPWTHRKVPDLPTSKSGAVVTYHFLQAVASQSFRLYFVTPSN